MDEKILEALKEDFEVSVKPGRGSYKYVKTSLILDRLNKVFKGNWSTEVVTREAIDDEVLVHVSVCVRSDQGDILSCHDGFGSAKKFAGTEIGNLYKSAKSKAIKDAVKNWGVALFLDDEDGASAPAHNQPSNVVSMVPPTNNTHPSNAPPENNVPTNSLALGDPQLPTEVVNTPANVPPTNTSPTNTPVVLTDTPPSNEVLPNMPPVSSGSVPPSNNVPTDLPTMTTGAPSALPTVNTAITGITDVQEVAIQSKLDHKGLDFAPTVQEMYESTGKDINTAPASLKDMEYNDALTMVNFVTNK